ncbi:hypothetical protein BDR05DRAFT_186125 [Suillus weaverae]|nr:hypothetical protein BDR05DRAFT_186125 [Suillus weaverae]
MITRYGVYVFGECRTPPVETVARATALDVPLKYLWSDFKRIKVGYVLLHSLTFLKRNPVYCHFNLTLYVDTVQARPINTGDMAGCILLHIHLRVRELHQGGAIQFASGIRRLASLSSALSKTWGLSTYVSSVVWSSDSARLYSAVSDNFPMSMCFR